MTTIRLALVALLLTACDRESDDEPRPPASIATRVSQASPFAPGCDGAPQRGTNFRDTVVEPFLAIDPGNPAHLVGVWQQDRWSNGGAHGLLTGVSFDGGRTWSTASAPFSRCTGGSSANGGDYERASDPWVTLAPDGTAHQIALVFDSATFSRAILASRSTDGGLTWSPAATLARDEVIDFALDKGSITADPRDAKLVYAVWDRLTDQATENSPLARGPAWFTRTVDGGVSWPPAVAIYDPGADAQTVGNQIVVLPDGTLLNAFALLTNNSRPSPDASAALVRSTDRGASWSSPVIISPIPFAGTTDPKNGKHVRTGAILPVIAVDESSGALYAAWEDARFSGGARDGIVLTKSTDGGRTWSLPLQANQVPSTQAFNPTVAVARSGKIGLTYYDLRSDDAADQGRLLASAWLATSIDGGATWQEVPIGGPFDLRAAPFSGGYFLGDYQGLVHAGDAFVAFFVMAGAAVHTDVFVTPPIP